MGEERAVSVEAIGIKSRWGPPDLDQMPEDAPSSSRSSMTAMTFMAAPQLGHTSGSTAYNIKRRHEYLGGKSPAEYEQLRHAG